jgi:hypothetical protein
LPGFGQIVAGWPDLETGSKNVIFVAPLLHKYWNSSAARQNSCRIAGAFPGGDSQTTPGRAGFLFFDRKKARVLTSMAKAYNHPALRRPGPNLRAKTPENPPQTFPAAVTSTLPNGLF